MNHITTKQVDQLGRVVLPLNLRRKFHIKTGDHVAFSVDDNGHILLQKATPHCALCGNADDLKEFERGNVCGDCRTKISELG